MTFLGISRIAAICVGLCLSAPARPATQGPPPAADPAVAALADALRAAPDVTARAALIDTASEPARKGLRRELLVRANDARLQLDFRRYLAVAELAVWAMTHLGDRDGLASALISRGIAQAETGDVPGARASMNQSLAECEALGDKSCAARAVANLGIMNRRTGDYPAALDAYRRALEIQQILNEPVQIAATTNNIGTVYGLQGNYSRAVEYHQRALSMPAAEISVQINALNNLGTVFEVQGEYQRAIEYFRKARTLAIERGLPTPLSIDNNIGHNLAALGDEANAIVAFNQVLENARRGGVPRDEEAATYNLATIHQARGELAQAMTFMNRSLEISERVSDPLKIAEARIGRGELRLQMNDVPGAEADARVAYETARRISAPHQLWQAQSLLGLVARARKNYAEARRAFEESVQTIEDMRWQVAGTEQSFERFFAGKITPYHGLVEVLVDSGDANAALRYAEQARARVLLDVLERGRISETRARGEASPPMTLERAAALAGPADALLEFAVTPHRTFLFVVTQGVKPALTVHTIAIEQADLGRQVNAFRAALESRDLAFGEQARALYRLLLAPAAGSLAGRTSLVIVPDGALWNLPFQALQTPSRQFLVESKVVSYAPSLRVLEQARGLTRGTTRTRTSTRQMLAIGSIRGADADLAPLPGVERQVRSIARLYAPGSLALAGADATEHRFKAEAGGAAIVYLAGHGVLNDTNPMYSHISLAPSPAGDDEDGRLEAREMMDLPLSADLAVLSACDTALGRTGGGEGIVGMSWALLVAGAPTTLVSQWRIDETSTDALMLAFHTRLRAASPGGTRPEGTRGRAAALAAAARAMIATPRYRHPFYWAGFVLIGDGS